MIAFAFAAVLSVSPASAAGPSPDAVARAVDFIKANKGPHAGKRSKKEKEFDLKEADVNAYLQRWIHEQESSTKRREVAVKSAEVHFLDGHVVEADAVAQVAMGSLKALDPLGDSLLALKLKQALAMDNSVHLQCVIGAAKGKGYLIVRELRIKGIPVPASMVQEVLAIVGKKQRPPIDFSRPLELPNGIQKVEVQPDQVKIRVAPI